MAESFFATLKLELSESQSFESRTAAVFAYVELFYNRVRMHRSPMQLEQEYQPVRTVS